MTSGKPKFPREYPAAPLVGVGVVVWKDGRVLLVRRAKAPQEGTWSLPGGRQRLGETTRAAAAREVREEAGIDVTIAALLDVIDTITPDDDGRVRYHYTLVDYDADWRSGELAAGGDVDDAIWADPEALEPYALWSETVRMIRLSAEVRGEVRDAMQGDVPGAAR